MPNVISKGSIEQETKAEFRSLSSEAHLIFSPSAFAILHRSKSLNLS